MNDLINSLEQDVLYLVSQSCLVLVTSWTVAHQAPLFMGTF